MNSWCIVQTFNRIIHAVCKIFWNCWWQSMGWILRMFLSWKLHQEIMLLMIWFPWNNSSVTILADPDFSRFDPANIWHQVNWTINASLHKTQGDLRKVRCKEPFEWHSSFYRSDTSQTLLWSFLLYMDKSTVQPWSQMEDSRMILEWQPLKWIRT